MCSLCLAGPWEEAPGRPGSEASRGPAVVQSELPSWLLFSLCLLGCSALEFSEVTDVSPDLQKGWGSQHEEVAILGHF